MKCSDCKGPLTLTPFGVGEFACLKCAEEQGSAIYIKPPVGMTPKHIWKARRLQEVAGAINRYMQANCPIPIEWIEEYNEIVGDPE